MDDKYYVIKAGENGTRIEMLDKKTLQERLKEQFWGEIEILSEIPGVKSQETDPNYWGNVLIIIKGKIVIPVPEQKITKWVVMVPRSLWEEIVKRAANTQPKLSAAQMVELLLRQGLETATRMTINLEDEK